MKNLFSIFTLFLCGACFAQDTISFKDEFIDNSNNWIIADDATQLIKISDGKYIFENKGAGALWVHKNFFLDNTKDFPMETTMTQSSGDDSSGFGMVIGLDNGDNYCIFNITSTKHFIIYENRTKKYNELKPWTISESISP